MPRRSSADTAARFHALRSKANEHLDEREARKERESRPVHQPCVVQWQRPGGSLHRDPCDNVPAACDRANVLRRDGIRALVYSLNQHGANGAVVDEGCLAPVARSR